MNKVFECPNCQQPFQVKATQAGQVVQCPGCTNPVEISADAFKAPRTPDSSKPQIHSCPSCRGQFGITSDMFGKQVGCPHCQASILIEEPAANPEPDDVATPSESEQRKPRFKTRSKKPIETILPNVAQASTKPRSSQMAESQPATRSSQAKQPRASQPPPTKTSAAKASAANLNPKKQKSTAGSQSGENKRLAAKAPQSSATSEPRQETDAAATIDVKLEVVAEPIDPRPSIAHLLPPLFEALDPTQLGSQSGADAFKVMLPDGEGGTKQVDQRIVRVEHGGLQVSLVAMTQAEKRRRKLIQNIIAIVIGIIVLAVAFTLLQ